MTTTEQIGYSKFEDLPSLRDGWVRLVHRCIYKDHVDSIRENGLIFNRDAAKLSPLQRGSSYPNITHMASVYDEESFWKSMHKDDFSCYNDAEYSDTKIVFDMPLDEFCFLQKFGRKIKGKIDSKYIVGIIPNVNGANKDLQTSHEKIDKAEKISCNNPPASIGANNVKIMIDELLKKIKSDNKEEYRNIVYERIKQCKEDLEYCLKDNQSRKNIPLTVMNRNRGLSR